MARLGFAMIGFVMLLTGCAELRNRGGTLDWLEDRFLFVADTKQMRVLRSDIIIAALTRLAGKSPATLAERHEMAAIIQTARRRSAQALDCATDSKPDDQGKRANIGKSVRGCAFFDDLMASVDSSIVRLARAVFLPEENRDLIVLIRKGLDDSNAPVAGLWDVLNQSGKALEASGNILTIGGKAVDGVGAILRLATGAFQTGGRLAAIYRDAIELEMQIALDFLEKSYKKTYNRDVNCEELHNSVDDWRVVVDQPGVSDETFWYPRLYCQYANGAGHMKNWRHNLSVFFKSPRYRHVVLPRAEHFAQVDELMGRACRALVGDEKCEPKKDAG